MRKDIALPLTATRWNNYRMYWMDCFLSGIYAQEAVEHPVVELREPELIKKPGGVSEKAVKSARRRNHNYSTFVAICRKSRRRRPFVPDRVLGRARRESAQPDGGAHAHFWSQ